MKKKIILIAFIVISVGAVWWAMKKTTQSIAPTVDPVTVNASKVQESTLPLTIHALGVLTARGVNITPEMPGHVRKIKFNDGEFVKKGTLLIQLDDAVYQTKYDSAQAQFVYSENNYKRMALLGKKGVIAQQAIEQAKAELIEKKAMAKENAVMLEKMGLKAPFDGKLGKCQINKGDYVTVGQNMVTLTDTTHLRIEYTVPEKYLPDLKLGQKVNITTAAYPNKIFTGTLSFISPSINTDNHSILLYADVDNQADQLAPGMFVNVTQSLASQEHVLLVPAKSLVPVLDSVQVYKIVNNKAYATTILVGKRSKDKVQVVDGLTASDVVITDGQLKIKNGDNVKVGA